jgi:hypothetical protein
VARRTKRRPHARTLRRRSRVQSAAGKAAGKDTAAAVGTAITTGVGTTARSSRAQTSTRKRGEYKKPEQELIRELVDKEWPAGQWKYLSSDAIRKGLETSFKKMGLPNPKSDHYLRALSRRKDKPRFR